MAIYTQAQHPKYLNNYLYEGESNENLKFVIKIDISLHYPVS